jgi:hypothetical protein
VDHVPAGQREHLFESDVLPPGNEEAVVLQPLQELSVSQARLDLLAGHAYAFVHQPADYGRQDAPPVEEPLGGRIGP